MNRRALALAALVFGTGPLCVLAQPGETPHPGAEVRPGEAAGGPKARALERRRERREAREWIEAPEMGVEELLALLGDPALAVVDVTCRERGERIREQIPGTVWRDCAAVEAWAPEYGRDQTVVVYCA